ncbi:MAG: PHP domain-containing protein, partial [Rickettsiales bacterium]|nr:PHP domain-containing protein [Rickettsiales bacterium]
MTKFLHLRNHTEYSLCKGTIKVKKVVEYLKQNNIPAFAMTDSHAMFGALEFCSAAADKGIQPIVGCETVLNISNLVFSDNKKFFSQREEEENLCKIVILAQTNEGYLNLMSLITGSYINRGNIRPNVPFEELQKKGDGLIILSGSSGGCFEKLLLTSQYTQAEKVAKVFLESFKDRFYVELQRHGWEREMKIEEDVLDIAYKYSIPLVATNDCYFVKKSMFEAQDALSCIADGKYITETDRERLTPEHYLKTEEEMLELFADVPEATENTVNIAKRIFTMSYSRKPKLPHFPVPEGATEEEELIRLSRIGLKERLEKKFVMEKITDEAAKEEIRKQYFDQMEFELDVITKMDFAGYFLIVSDFIMWSKNNGVPIGPGRGSGA